MLKRILFIVVLACITIGVCGVTVSVGYDGGATYNSIRSALLSNALASEDDIKILLSGNSTVGHMDCVLRFTHKKISIVSTSNSFMRCSTESWLVEATSATEELHIEGITFVNGSVGSQKPGLKFSALNVKFFNYFQSSLHFLGSGYDLIMQNVEIEQHPPKSSLGVGLRLMNLRVNNSNIEMDSVTIRDSVSGIVLEGNNNSLTIDQGQMLDAYYPVRVVGQDSSITVTNSKFIETVMGMDLTVANTHVVCQNVLFEKPNMGIYTGQATWLTLNNCTFNSAITGLAIYGGGLLTASDCNWAYSKNEIRSTNLTISDSHLRVSAFTLSSSQQAIFTNVEFVDSILISIDSSLSIRESTLLTVSRTDTNNLSYLQSTDMLRANCSSPSNTIDINNNLFLHTTDFKEALIAWDKCHRVIVSSNTFYGANSTNILLSRGADPLQEITITNNKFLHLAKKDSTTTKYLFHSEDPVVPSTFTASGNTHCNISVSEEHLYPPELIGFSTNSCPSGADVTTNGISSTVSSFVTSRAVATTTEIVCTTLGYTTTTEASITTHSASTTARVSTRASSSSSSTAVASTSTYASSTASSSTRDASVSSAISTSTSTAADASTTSAADASTTQATLTTLAASSTSAAVISSTSSTAAVVASSTSSIATGEAVTASTNTEPSISSSSLSMDSTTETTLATTTSTASTAQASTSEAVDSTATAIASIASTSTGQVTQTSTTTSVQLINSATLTRATSSARALSSSSTSAAASSSSFTTHAAATTSSTSNSSTVSSSATTTTSGPVREPPALICDENNRIAAAECVEGRWVYVVLSEALRNAALGETVVLSGNVTLAHNTTLVINGAQANVTHQAPLQLHHGCLVLDLEQTLLHLTSLPPSAYDGTSTDAEYTQEVLVSEAACYEIAHRDRDVHVTYTRSSNYNDECARVAPAGRVRQSGGSRLSVLVDVTRVHCGSGGSSRQRASGLSSGKKVGIIVGSVVGGVIVLAGIVILVFVFVAKQNPATKLFRSGAAKQQDTEL